MSKASVPVDIAVLAFPEVTASGVFGIYDLFLSAGRDWGRIVEGRPGPTLMQPRIASARGEAFAAGNGVMIKPEVTLDACPAPTIVCVPEILLAPEDSLDGKFEAEIAWLQKCYAAGAV